MTNHFLAAKARLLLSLWLFLLLLSACVAQPFQAIQLPTRAATAPPVPVYVNIDGTNVPVTWTPLPTNIAEINNEPVTRGPTAVPSATPLIPTYTPVPPTPTLTPTPSNTPAPTPYTSFIPHLPPSGDLGPSKLGIHVNRNNDPAIMEFVRRAQPAVMKGVGDLGFLEEVKQVSPRTITVGRVPNDVQHYGGNPEEEAREWVADHLFQYRSNPYVDYWEGWNEPDPNVDNMAWYARFEAERAREMARHGFRVAIGGFPAGVPELHEFELFLPAIEAAIQHQGIMTLHEGSAPTIDYLFGAPLPGYPAYPDRGAMSFRYRWYYREILEPAGLAIPLVISELGIDGQIGMNRPGPQGLGWRDFQGYWAQEGGWGSSGVDAFINQLAWYDNGVRQDGYVIGFAIFTAGGTSRWESYDVNSILPRLADYVIGQR
jgi:hypothetical protein